MHLRPIHYILIALIVTAAGFLYLHLSRERYNLVLVSIDTLRPDHLGCYGYGRDTSPAIDRVAREGLVFREVVSQSPWTLPSHATMLTSTYSSVHGVTRDDRVLSPSFTTLAEYLAQAGYRTAAFTGGGYMNRRFGFDQGFEIYMDRYTEGEADPFLDVHWSTFRNHVLDWLGAHHDEPFFLFVHSYDVHKPYDPPRELVTPFFPECRGEIITFNDHRTVIVKVPDRPPETIPVDSLPASLRDHLVAHYDAEIREVDREVAILREALDGLGVLDRTLIVITSDHGEQFLEHGSLGHRNTLFGEEIGVPLVMRLPPLIPPGTAVGEPAAVVDIMPTVLDMLGVPHDGLFGKSLVGSTERRKPAAIISEYDEGGLAAVREKDRKLVASAKERSVRLFDLENDPAEQVDISRRNPEEARRLFQMLTGMLAVLREAGAEYRSEAPAGERDEYITEQLRALGYIEE